MDHTDVDECSECGESFVLNDTQGTWACSCGTFEHRCETCNVPFNGEQVMCDPCMDAYSDPED